MCGIFGIVGTRDAAPIVMDALKRLEYRGYDSAGVAVLDGRRLQVRKAQGRLEKLQARLCESPVSGMTGIGQTRWATHGEPSDANAHPHTDAENRFAVVHNGIIENHAELRRELESSGVVFRSQTDTEVVAHLLSRAYRGDAARALSKTIPRLRGAYALAILCRDTPEAIYCVRHDSPLVVGMGEGEMLLASDPQAILPHTRRIARLPDNLPVTLTREGCAPALEFEETDLAERPADLDGWPHYMLKEIHEQPLSMQRLLARGEFPGIATPERVVLVGCGSAYHAACVGKLAIEKLARIPTEADIASEFRYRSPILTNRTLCVFISQSGETADTLAALRLTQGMPEDKRPQTLGIVNVEGSTLAREAEHVLFTRAGAEIAVATTKGYITQALALLMLASRLSEKALPGLDAISEKAVGLLADDSDIRRYAARHAGCRSVFYIGRGMDYALAMEASLKLKEISYAHSEAYAAGELKHGTIALIEPGTPVIALATQEALLDKTLANIREVRARGAQVLALTMESMRGKLEDEAETIWTIPDVDPLLAPLLGIIPMQLFAYHVAVARGCDVDKPRNLAKSVTVE